MKKNLLVLFALALSLNFLHAATADCASAKDSVKVRLAKNELSFYAPAKGMPKVLYFYNIDKNHYQKIAVKKMKADTSVDFMTCYNKAIQPKLDSVFKCDFFRKIDSITTSYDVKGMGYRTSQFRGGQDSLNYWLSKHVNLPASAAPDDTTKIIKLYYFAQIDEQGNVTDIKFAKSNCKACEPIVTEALKKLPLFVPATQAGKPSKSTFILPYNKKLQ